MPRLTRISALAWFVTTAEGPSSRFNTGAVGAAPLQQYLVALQGGHSPPSPKSESTPNGTFWSTTRITSDPTPNGVINPRDSVDRCIGPDYFSVELASAARCCWDRAPQSPVANHGSL